MLILRGFAQGVPTAQLARELGCDRKHLLGLRRTMQDNAERWLDRNPLGDEVVEADWDGVREVHCNTMEGIWTGARNFRRPFRGVSKWCASQYVGYRPDSCVFML